jgi:hypothetical protein
MGWVGWFSRTKSITVIEKDFRNELARGTDLPSGNHRFRDFLPKKILKFVWKL